MEQKNIMKKVNKYIYSYVVYRVTNYGFNWSGEYSKRIDAEQAGKITLERYKSEYCSGIKVVEKRMLNPKFRYNKTILTTKDWHKLYRKVYFCTLHNYTFINVYGTFFFVSRDSDKWNEIITGIYAKKDRKGFYTLYKCDKKTFDKVYNNSINSKK